MINENQAPLPHSGKGRCILDETTVNESGAVYALSMENITKIYSNGFIANKGITFRVKKGEIHGLVGENGAGKTTLMKVLFGQERPEEGTIRINGEAVEIKNPLDALGRGIGMVHQHFMLVESLTVAENMVLGYEEKKGILFNYNDAVRMTEEISQRYNLPIEPHARVSDLSVGYKQRVEILKMLLRGVKILLLDEPTAVLTPQETEELFVQLKSLRDLGYTIVFISHKLNEIKEICDNITVLRRGRVTGAAKVSEVGENDIARMMVGRDVFLNIEKRPAEPGGVILSMRNVSHISKIGARVLDDVSFDVREGEILGVAGVEGNGQAELSELIGGLLEIQTGEIRVKGELMAGKTIRQIREKGVSLIHEDRMAYGVSNNQSISENTISDRYYKDGYYSSFFLNLKSIRDKTKKLISDFSIKCDGPEAEIKTLSGGNIQKVVAAREYSSEPALLIASHPTRGIDVGATELIRNKMVALRDDNRTGVLLFSADLNELLTVSDGIIVMYDGRIVAYFPDARAIDEHILGEYMLGLKTQSPEEIGGVRYV